MTLSTLWFNYF